MGEINNNPKLKERRRELRRNQTEAEKFLWAKLRNKQLQGVKFFRQFSIGPYILDFYSPKFRLTIELDGGQHAEPENIEYDKERSSYIESQGIEVLRFWNNEVFENMEGVLYRIDERLNSPQPPLS